MLEGETYLGIVDQQKLIDDFGLGSIPEVIEVKASLLVFEKSSQHKEIKNEPTKLMELIKFLDSQIFLIEESENVFKVIKP